MKKFLPFFLLLGTFPAFSQDLFFSKGDLTNPVLPKITRLQHFEFKYQFDFESNYSVKDNAPDKNFSTKTYLSVDTVLSNDDLYMYEDAISDQYVFGEVHLDCNSSISGNWYVLVQLDANNVVKESDETNNVGYFSLHIPYVNQCGRLNKRIVTYSTQFQKGQIISKSDYHIEIQSTSMADTVVHEDLYSFDRTNVFVVLSKDLLLDNSDVYLNMVSPSTYPQLFVTSKEKLPTNSLCQSLTSPTSHAPIYKVAPNTDYGINVLYPCNTSLQIPFTVADGYYYLLFYSSALPQNTPPVGALPYNGGDYEYFTSTRIQVGTVTDVQESLPLEQPNPILHYYDLSGREIEKENAQDKVVIASYANGVRKLVIPSEK